MDFAFHVSGYLEFRLKIPSSSIVCCCQTLWNGMNNNAVAHFPSVARPWGAWSRQMITVDSMTFEWSWRRACDHAIELNSSLWFSPQNDPKIGVVGKLWRVWHIFNPSVILKLVFQLACHNECHLVVVSGNMWSSRTMGWNVDLK